MPDDQTFADMAPGTPMEESKPMPKSPPKKSAETASKPSHEEEVRSRIDDTLDLFSRLYGKGSHSEDTGEFIEILETISPTINSVREHRGRYADDAGMIESAIKDRRFHETIDLVVKLIDRASFERIPSTVRTFFKNDPVLFAHFVAYAGNKREFIRAELPRPAPQIRQLTKAEIQSDRMSRYQMANPLDEKFEDQTDDDGVA